jgi:hypothetical protein
LRAGHSHPVSSQLSWRPLEARGVPPGFPLPFGRWRSLLGPSCPAGDLRLPYGRPTKTSTRRLGPQPGFPRSTRVRYDRGGCPLYPGAVVSTRATRNEPLGTRRFPTASPTALLRQPIDRASAVTRHQPRVHSRSPVRSSPRPWLPGWNGGPPAFPELRTLPLPATHVGAGTDHLDTDQDLHHQHHRTSKGATTHNVRPRVALPPCGVPVWVSS